MARTNDGTGTAGASPAELAAALAGDGAAFIALGERHRPELRAYCYRMLGSFNDAEDLVQETLIRAWQKRDTFQGRSPLRAWLYGIATNACLDFLAKNPHRVLAHEGDDARPAGAEPALHVPWLQPYPDRLLEPEAVATSKQTIGIAFLVAVQFLPVKQRAALILSDLLDWSASESAALLGLSVASVNSALQRARATLRDRQPRLQPERKPDFAPDEQQRTLLERYVSATERGDAAGLAALLRDDVRFSMPPEPGTYFGRDAVVGGWVDGGFGSDWFGDFRCLVTRANRMPAVACYLRKPRAAHFRAMAVDVLDIEDGLVKEITTFPLETMVRAFDLPPEL
jgi:RNA polymerase sigma-70 factor, ECF subfamily